MKKPVAYKDRNKKAVQQVQGKINQTSWLFKINYSDLKYTNILSYFN